MIVVVAAVIERDGSFLVTRRQRGVHLAGSWEFPGGKVDGTETHAQALRREILEEIGADVDVRELRLHVEHAYVDRTVALYFYDCMLIGEPVALLGQEMRWVPRAELASLGFAPADEALIELLAGAGR